MQVKFIIKENSNKINENIIQKKCSDSFNIEQNREKYLNKNIYFNLQSLNSFLSDECKDFYDKFELLELLKSGSAGAVYMGQLRNRTNSKQIAFKFLFDISKAKRDKKTKEKSKKQKKERNQHLEINIHGKLKSQHIPEIYGYYKIQDDSCIAMEYIKYGDIENFKRKVLKRSSLSESLVLYIAGGILKALYYIHIKNKIIHMDIKQQNILIDDFLTVKLTDFSVSLNYSKAKDYIHLPMVGTCYYMSPEVLRKKKISVSEASKIDIYSLGVLLYLLAFCDYPYKLNEVNSKDYERIAKNVEEKELEFPKDTGHSNIFLNFLKSCLNKDIKKRYNIHEAMKDPWFGGYQILLNEKEKLYNAGQFLIALMVDNIMPFNNFIKDLEQ